MSSAVAAKSGLQQAAWLLTLMAVAWPMAAAARDEPGTASANNSGERIDILVRPVGGEASPRLVEECKEQEDAARISGEIVVCRQMRDVSRFTTLPRDEAQTRYARETAFAGSLPSPDVAGPGIFRGPATISGLCIPGLQKCPPPPALMIDLAALPQAPPGSDADRIARGLPPLGNDAGDRPPGEAELGLPPPVPPIDASAGAVVNPAGSAAPAAPQ